MNNDMLLGAIAMSSLIAGLFFLRFWKSTRDRFFLFFAIAFWIDAVSRVFHALAGSLSENVPTLYLIRFFTFGLILFAVIDKNWPKKS